mmetsp:Transcript_6250/g.18862  ORF Transcript_6250/g.18862 Transcript_6250/m.18862 type:complete len:1282 (+) Transcript_6250:91-3936(+)
MGRINPESGAGFVSSLLYLWLDPLLKLGYERPLDLEDLHELQDGDTSKVLAKKFEHHWAQEQARHGEKASILRALYRAYGKLFVRAAPLKAVYDCLHFVGPFALHGVLKNIGQRSAVFYAVLLLVSMFAQTMLLQQYFMMCFRCGIHVRAGVMSSVFQKSLRLSTASRNKESVGQMVNLLSVDSNRIGPRLLPYAHMLWSGPLQIITAFVILYRMIGLGALSGSLVMACIIPLNLYIARVKNSVQRQLMQRKDERVRVLNEVFSFIRQVKFFAWEDKLRQRVEDAREKELMSLRASSLLSALGSVLWNIAPLAVSCVAFTTMALATETPLTPASVFVALALFNILRFPLTMFPSLVNNSIEAHVAARRIERFLQSSEAPGRREDPNEDAAAGFKGGSYTWKETVPAASASESSKLLAHTANPERPVLERLQVRFTTGNLAIVVGPVGCGKSSLLLALLGEMPCASSDEEREFLNGKVSYASQTPWLMNATVRENILFGQEYDADRYREVISACCLQRDLEILPVGDATEIGEKGITLSGGQKARVALARALYRDADVYLLDDPLSAVDAHVGKALFEKAICGPLVKNKTRILVTHHLQYIERSDRVVVMEGGKVVADGGYRGLKRKGFNFSFLSLADDSEEKDDDKPGLGDTDGEKNEKQDDKLLGKKPAETNGRTNGTLMTVEERAVGKVRFTVYMEYFNAVGYGFIVFYVAMSLLVMGSLISVDGWLSKWTGTVIASGSSLQGNSRFVIIYIVLAIVSAVLTFGRQVMVVFAVLRAGRKLHDRMLRALLRSPVSFFDSTPIGRIINRFSKDQTSVDEELPDALTSLLSALLRVGATMAVVTFVTWRIIFLVVFLAMFYVAIGKLYITTSRELRRLDSNTKGPILAFFGEALVGVESVRAFNAAGRFKEENERRIDTNTKPMLLNVAANRWLSVRLETVGTLFVATSALLAVLGGGVVPAALAGLSLTYALQVTQTLSWMVRMSTDTETQMNSVERVRYYAQLPPEAPVKLENDPKPEEWPTQGEIEFKDVVMRYRKDIEPALQHVGFKIKAREKIGVVGRTGAGKTSLAQALFRMIEIEHGSISIDGRDISKLGLHVLRGRLGVITQDPMLVSSTVRYNLDPFQEKTDEQIWRALEAVSMKEPIRNLPDGLDSAVHDGGQNFSVGQRQLLCLGRALLRDTKVMVLDEATAAIDHDTDDLVQKTIRKTLTHCTLITVAHRLQTVMDSDQILVMDKGKVAEMGPPIKLLSNSRGLFSKLVAEVGGEMSNKLRRMALQNRRN